MSDDAERTREAMLARMPPEVRAAYGRLRADGPWWCHPTRAPQRPSAQGGNLLHRLPERARGDCHRLREWSRAARADRLPCCAVGDMPPEVVEDFRTVDRWMEEELRGAREMRGSRQSSPARR